MNKLLMIGALLLASVNTSAYGYMGFLQGSYVSGMYRVCNYSNGKVVTVKSYAMCPLKVAG